MDFQEKISKKKCGLSSPLTDIGTTYEEATIKLYMYVLLKKDLIYDGGESEIPKKCLTRQQPLIMSNSEEEIRDQSVCSCYNYRKIVNCS